VTTYAAASMADPCIITGVNCKQCGQLFTECSAVEMVIKEINQPVVNLIRNMELSQFMQ